MSVYRDRNASAPLGLWVRDAIPPYFAQHQDTPSNRRRFERAARVAIEKTRQAIA